HAPDLIHQDDACHALAAGNGDFERIALRLVSDGRNQRQPRPMVIHLGTEHQRRTPPGLLMSSLGIKTQPDEIANGGNVGGYYHDSLPAGGPQSVSECRFLVVIRDTSCRNSYFRRAERKTMLPSVARLS